jgi:hypothetical protein
MSYETSNTDAYRLVADPGRLAMHQVKKVELLLNLKTAKALGLIIPASLLARADKVIEYNNYCEGLRMPAVGDRSHTQRRPASANLQCTKSREGE